MALPKYSGKLSNKASPYVGVFVTRSRGLGSGLNRWSCSVLKDSKCFLNNSLSKAIVFDYKNFKFKLKIDFNSKINFPPFLLYPIIELPLFCHKKEMNSTNPWGYIKCDKNCKNKISIRLPFNF